MLMLPDLKRHGCGPRGGDGGGEWVLKRYVGKKRRRYDSALSDAGTPVTRPSGKTAR